MSVWSKPARLRCNAATLRPALPSSGNSFVVPIAWPACGATDPDAARGDTTNFSRRWVRDRSVAVCCGTRCTGSVFGSQSSDGLEAGLRRTSMSEERNHTRHYDGPAVGSLKGIGSAFKRELSTPAAMDTPDAAEQGRKGYLQVLHRHQAQPRSSDARSLVMAVAVHRLVGGGHAAGRKLCRSSTASVIFTA